MKKLIVTGDDFGLSIPFNLAITQAHQNGILTTASLMVSAPAAADAVERARSLTSLNVGLHLVLISGVSCLPHAQIPGLVDQENKFSENSVASGFKMFFLPGVRRQMEAEIRAQFEAFKKTGLRLDHVNAHKHMHLHPTVLDLIIRIGKDYGLQAVRVPAEPPLQALINNKTDWLKRHAWWWLLKPLVTSMKNKLRANHIRFNDYIFGLHDSGHMHMDTMIRILSHLPDGLSEMYTHPATGGQPASDPSAHDYEHEAEYKALIHPRIKRTLEKFSIEPAGFASADRP